MIIHYILLMTVRIVGLQIAPYDWVSFPAPKKAPLIVPEWYADLRNSASIKETKT